MKDIKMVDLHAQYLRIKPEIDKAIEEVLTSTAFIQGPQVYDFANALAEYTGAEHVIPCANGTDALQIAMMAVGLKPGDEVIVPVHTYVATAEVIALLGLVPVFVDVEEDTFNINVSRIESLITEKTKAIVPVHLYGQCADMEAILSIAADHGLHVIEDAAQALGAEYSFSDGTTRTAGTMGIIGTTSFFPSKNLGCYGDGGAIFTSDAELAGKIKMIANHGQRIKYHHDLIGVNSRLDTLQAAILNVKLKSLIGYTQRRNEVAGYYDKHIASAYVTLPVRSGRSSHVFHQYTLTLKSDPADERNRDGLNKFLADKGIPSMIYYPVPCHKQKMFDSLGGSSFNLPLTDWLTERVISLPIHTELDEEQQDFVIKSVLEYIN